MLPPLVRSLAVVHRLALSAARYLRGSRSRRQPGRIAYATTLPLLIASAASSQTFIVDPAGGGHFRTIFEAVPLVPSGATLRVRAGNQFAFSIQNKSLKVIADSGCYVVNAHAITIGPTAPTETVVLDNLNIVGNGDNGWGNLVIQDAKGPVLLRNCTLGVANNFFNNPTLAATGCPNLHVFNTTFLNDYYAAAIPRVALLDSAAEMTSCRVVATAGQNGYRSILGWQKAEVPGPAVRVTNGRLTLVDCAVAGGKGGDEPASASPYGAAEGAPAVLAVGSTLHVHGPSQSIRGGAGGAAQATAGGNGAAAIELRSGAQATYDAVGVIGGGAGMGTPPGAAGATLLRDGTSQANQLPQRSPTMILYGTPPPSYGFGVDLRAGGGDVAALLLGQRSLMLAASGLLSLGTLCVDPALAFSSFVVPSTGVLTLRVPLPQQFPLYELVVAQFAVLPRGLATIWMSNAAEFLLR